MKKDKIDTIEVIFDTLEALERVREKLLKWKSVVRIESEASKDINDGLYSGSFSGGFFHLRVYIKCSHSFRLYQKLKSDPKVFLRYDCDGICISIMEKSDN